MPQYITIEDIKRQCNIDLDFHDDDEFLEMIGNSAEDMCSSLLDCPLPILEAQHGELPATIKHAIRMLCDYFYSQQRGSTSESIDIPNAVLVMLKLYRTFH